MSNWKALLTTIFLACLCSINSKAQCYGCCVDSTYINTNSNCGYDYTPECGCDGKTYRNDCYRHDRAGVQTFNPGPCDPVDFMLAPVPVATTDPNGLILQIAVKTSIDVQYIIMDVYGVQLAYVNLGYVDQNLSPYPSIQIPIQNMKTGVYIIIVKTGLGYFKIKRFVVANT